MRRPSKSITVRTVKELFLVHRFKKHYGRPLKHLVFKTGYPQRSHPPVIFRYVRPPHRWRPVRPRLRTLFQVCQFVVQPFGGVVRPRHTVHSCRPVLARTPVGLFQPFLIKVLIQRHHPELRLPPCQFRYALLFRVHVSGFHCIRHVSLQRLHLLTRPFPPSAPVG